MIPLEQYARRGPDAALLATIVPRDAVRRCLRIGPRRVDEVMGRAAGERAPITLADVLRALRRDDGES